MSCHSGAPRPCHLRGEHGERGAGAACTRGQDRVFVGGDKDGSRVAVGGPWRPNTRRGGSHCAAWGVGRTAPYPASAPACARAEDGYVNRPHRIGDAEFKSSGLAAAVAAGFLFPPTLITSEPDAARTFVKRHGPDRGRGRSLTADGAERNRAPHQPDPSRQGPLPRRWGPFPCVRARRVRQGPLDTAVGVPCGSDQPLPHQSAAAAHQPTRTVHHPRTRPCANRPTGGLPSPCPL